MVARRQSQVVSSRWGGGLYIATWGLYSSSTAICFIWGVVHLIIVQLLISQILINYRTLLIFWLPKDIRFRYIIKMSDG